MRRFVIAGLSGVHVLALAMILLPHAKPTAAWRKALERPMRTWIHATVAQQFWKMFADGDRDWATPEFVVVLRDADGNSTTIGDGILAADDRRGFDRRQQIGGSLRTSERLREAHLGWVCRNFTVPSGGEFTVEFHRVRQSMPWPEQLVAIGPDRAEAHAEASRHWKPISEHRCPDVGQ